MDITTPEVTPTAADTAAATGTTSATTTVTNDAAADLETLPETGEPDRPVLRLIITPAPETAAETASHPDVSGGGGPVTAGSNAADQGRDGRTGAGFVSGRRFGRRRAAARQGRSGRAGTTRPDDTARPDSTDVAADGGTAAVELREQRDRIRSVAVLPPDARRIRRRILAAGLATGRPVDDAALTVVLAALSIHHPGPANLLTEDIVWQLVWFDVYTWCTNRGVDVPPRVAETIWILVVHLATNNELHEASDEVERLRAPLLSSAGLSASGRSRHPAG